MKNIIHSRKGFMLVELLVALAILVILVIGIGTSMGAANRVYSDSVFDSNNASISGIINSSLEDLLRYAEVEVDADHENYVDVTNEYFKLTNDTYSVREARIGLNQDGYIVFTGPYSGESHYLVAPGVYVDQHLESFSIKYDTTTGLYTITYKLVSDSDPDQTSEVEFSARSSNASTKYLEEASKTEKEEWIPVYLHYVDQDGQAAIFTSFDVQRGKPVTTSHSELTNAYTVITDNPEQFNIPGWVTGKWYRSANAGGVFSNQEVFAPLHLYLRFSINYITVHFDSCGGTYCPDVEYAYGDRYFSDLNEYYIDAAQMKKAGYTFDGWWTAPQVDGENSGGERVANDATVQVKQESLTLYAHWKVKTYRVIFDINDGTTHTDRPWQELKYDTTQTLRTLSDLNRNGGDFKRSYNVAYALGTTEGSGFTTKLKNYIAGKVSEVAPGASFDLEFRGWSIDKNAEFGEFEDGAEAYNLTEGDSITLYAIWAPPVITLPTIPSENSTACTGWYYDTACTQYAGIPGGYVTLTKQTTVLYGKWVFLSYCKVTLNYLLNDSNKTAIIEPLVVYVEHNKPFQLPAFPGAGYHVVKWTSDTGSQYAANGTVSFDDGWLGINTNYARTYTATCARNTITFYNGSTKVETKEYEKDSSGHRTKLAAAPSNSSGAIFGGWYTKPDNADGSLQAGSVRFGGAGDEYPYDLYDDNINLYAHWIRYSTTLKVREEGAKIQGLNTTEYTTKGSLNLSNYKAVLEGYRFLGWFDDVTGQQYTGVFEPTDRDHVLTARFVKIRTVTFDPMEGEMVGPNTLKNDSADGSLTLPEAKRIGYNLKGWGTEENCTDDKIVGKAGDKYTPTKDLTLYAQWTPKTYTVTLDVNGGTMTGEDSYTQKTVTYGKKYGAGKILPEAERAGYRFVGWFTAKEDGDQILNSTVVDEKTIPSNGDVKEYTLYAHWESKPYTVTLDANGGSVYPASVQVYYNDKYGSLPEPYAPYGMQFDGWYLSKDSSDTNKITSLTVMKQSKDHTLYAHWTGKVVEVTFNAHNGESSASYKVTYNKKYGDAFQSGELPVPKREGYTFLGWFELEVGGSEIKKDSTVTKVTNHMIHAHWKANEYTVSFSGGSQSYASVKVTYDSPYGTKLPTLSSSDPYHTFAWFLDNNTFKNEVTQDTIVKTAKDHTLYLHETARKYNINLNANGGKITTATGLVATTTVQVTYGQTYSTLLTPTRTGYQFLGWFTAKEGGEQVKTTDSITNAVADTLYANGGQTLYAHWKAIEYTITYELNGGTHKSETPYTKYTIESDTITLTVAERKGYSFKGWYTTSTFDDGTKLEKITKGSTGDLKLYAKWKAKTYTLTYMDVTYNTTTKVNGTTYSQIAQKTVTYDQPYGDAANVTPKYTLADRTGYQAFAWYNAQTGGSKFAHSSTDTVKITSDLILYSRWTPKKATFKTSSYRKIEGNAVESKTLNYPIVDDSLPISMTKALKLKSDDSYMFMGWYEVNDSSKPIAGGSVDAINELIRQNTSGNNLAVRSVWLKLNFNGGTETAYPTPTLTSGTALKIMLPNLEAKSDGSQLACWVRVKDGTIAYAGRGNTNYTLPHYITSLMAFWFNGNGDGDTVTIPDIKYSDGTVTLPTPTRAGYKFLGWFTAASGGTKVTGSNYLASTSATLYAHWELKSYTIEYVLNNGTLSGSYPTSYNVNTETFNLPTPTRTGYDFKGWYTTSTFDDRTKLEKITKGSRTGDLKLYAKWEAKKYTVTLVKPVYDTTNNVYSTTQFEEVAKKTVTYDSTYASALDGVTMTVVSGRGYKSFDGWYTGMTGGTKITATTKVTITDNQTLYARWTPFCTKVYFLNDGTGTVSTALSREYKLTAEPTQPNSSNSKFFSNGDYFLGYYSSPKGGSAYAATKDNINRWTLEYNCDRSIYAYWLSFGDTVLPNGYTPTVTAEAGNVKVTLPALQKTGYSLTWSGKYWDGQNQTGKTLSASAISNNVLTVPGWRVELTQKLTANTYYVHFEGNGATSGSMNNETFTYDTAKALTANDFKKTGYTFAGWATSANGDKVYDDKASVKNLTDTANGEVTLYAKWTPTKYTIKYELDGGTNSDSNPSTYTINSAKITLADPSKTGYTFGGWYTSSNFASETQKKTIDKGSTGAVTLYAKWTANKYTIKYAKNGGSGNMADQSFTYDTAQNLTANAFKKTGYTFAGWKDASGNTYTDGQSVKNLTSEANGTVTLTAQWAINTYQLTVEGKYATITIKNAANGSTIINQRFEDKDSKTFDVPYGTVLSFYFVYESFKNYDSKSAAVKTPNDEGSNVKLYTQYKNGSVSGNGSTDAPSEKTTYYFTMPADTVLAKAKCTGDNNCIASGTLITMADGSQKPIELIEAGEEVLVFNHETGKLDTAPMGILVHKGEDSSAKSIMNLVFDNGTEIKVIAHHGFFDVDRNEYIYIDTTNYSDWIGHRFFSERYVNGKYISSAITLKNIYFTTEDTLSFAPITQYHLNYFTNGVLAMTSSMDGLFNIFELDETMKYDETEMQKDIEKYGLFSYDDFAEYIPYELYRYFPAEYFKVSIGKGNLTFAHILELVEKYSIGDNF